MMIKDIVSFCMLLFVGINPVFSQLKEAVEVLNKINDVYKTNDDYVINLTYVMSRSDNGAQIDRQQGVLKKSGKRMLFKLGDYETGSDEKFNITVDNFNKTVFLSDPVAIKPLNLADLKQDIMDKIFSLAEISDKSNNEKLMVLNIKQGDLAKVEITYNATNFRLKQVVSTYRRQYEEDKNSYPVKIVVTYDKHSDKVGLKESDFAPSKYLVTANNTFQLKPAYSNYRLINKIKKNSNL